MELWSSGVTGFFIVLKVPSLVSFLSLALWLYTLYPITIYFIYWLVSFFLDILVLKDITSHQCYGMIFYLQLIQLFLQSYNIIWLHYRIKKLHTLRKCFLVLFEGQNSHGYEIDLFLVHKYSPNHWHPTIPK